MVDEATLVFVEVRYRQQDALCNPLESITRSKQRKVIRTASHYLLTRFNSHDIACRFDAVGVTQQQNGDLKYEWVKNAFY